MREYSKKEFLFIEGDVPRYLFLLKSGRVKLVKTNEYGKEFIIDNRVPGQFFGYTALLSTLEYSFAAVALEPCAVTLIPKKDFMNLLYADRDVAVQLIKLLTNNVVEKEEQMLHLAFSSVRKRMANVLLQLAHKNPDQTIHILRDDLAGMVGTARESVVRLLSEFKKDGYIVVEAGGIKIVDAQQLRDIPG